MEKFRNEINIKIRYGILITTIIWIMLVLIKILKLKGMVVNSDIDNIFIGFNFGFIIVTYIKIINLKKSLSNNKRIKEFYVKYTDERSLLIRAKSANPLNLINLYIIMLAGYFLQRVSIYISYTCMVVAIILLLECIILELYYSKKI